MSGGNQDVMDQMTNGLSGRLASRTTNTSQSALRHEPDSPQHSASTSRPPKFWERSQSAAELDRPARYTSTSMLECSDGGASGGGGGGTGKVSEHSSVYWDLSTAADNDEPGTSSSRQHGAGKFKISLQTIHQKEEMAAAGGGSGSGTPASPSVSFQTRVIRRMSTESAASGTEQRQKTECSEFSWPPAVEFPLSSSATSGSPKSIVNSSSSSPPRSEDGDVAIQSGTTSTLTSKSVQARRVTLTYNNNHAGAGGAASGGSGSPSSAATLANAIPLMREHIRVLTMGGGKGGATVSELCQALRSVLQMIESAWSMPTIGRDVAYGLCDVLRTDGAVDALLRNCDVDADMPRDLRLGSAQVLAESMTVGNRDYVARIGGLEVVVRLAACARDDPPLSLAVTGILESLFKHSQTTCATLIRRGGLDAVLYSCRTTDVARLRRCAVALANLAIYGGADNQQEMIEHRAPEWLFPLAFSDDDSTRYYAFLAIAALGANATLEAAVVRSGTLGLVEPFVRSHDPTEFARSDQAHMHGQSSDWLRRLVPLLLSRRDEAQSLAAFHFAMEAGIRAEQGKLQVRYICIDSKLKALLTIPVHKI